MHVQLFPILKIKFKWFHYLRSKQTQQETDPESNPQKSKNSILLSSSLINKTAQAKSKNVSKFNMKSRLSGVDLVNSMSKSINKLVLFYVLLYCIILFL